MAQHDYTIANQTFPLTRQDINNLAAAVVSNNSGASEPTTMYNYQWWFDTNTNTLKFRNADNDAWISFATFDMVNDTVNLVDSAVDIVTDLSPQLGANLDLNSNDITGTGNINITGTATVSGDLTVDTDTLYVDSANNRVGIGTSSPQDSIHISQPSAVLRIEDTDTNHISTIQSAAAGLIISADATNTEASSFMAFNVDATERMRIDGSGNFLYAKTTTDTTTTGVEFRPSGLGYFGRSAGQPIIANRNTNDGDIIELRKNGSSVGGIGTYNPSGTGYNAPYIGGSFSAISFASNAIWPIVSNTNRAKDDGGIDLGTSDARFKDAYLSGNIYLGGTGSANALDDYETGTWTPAYSTQVSSFTSVTYDSITRGFYTKVGDVVFAQCHIRTDAITVGGASGDVYVDGFPFTVAIEDNEVHTAGGGIGYSTAFGGDMPSSYFCIRNDTKALLVYRTSANGSSLELNVNDLGTGSNANTVIATFIYKAQ